MKNILWLFILIASLFLVATNFTNVQTLATSFNKSVCDRPIGYRLDYIDPRFNVSRETFLSDVIAASNIWNQVSGKELFKHEPEGEVRVSLVYDERTSLSNKINELEGELKGKKGTIEDSAADYDKRVADFKNRLEALNSEIARWNEQGGAPPDVYQRLIDEQNKLKQEAEELSSMATRLNLSAGSFNAQVESLNQTVDQFNEAIEQKPEEGIFDPNTNEIKIYFTLSKNELIHTIAHEFGHARDLTHNNNSKSIMYSYSTQSLKVTPEDLASLQVICSKNLLVERARGYLTNLSYLLKLP